MKTTIILALGMFFGSIITAHADNVGLCKATGLQDGKTAMTTVYISGNKTAIEGDSPQGKFRTIQNAGSVFIIVDAQKLCLQSPIPFDAIAPGTKTFTNSDGSKVDCTWSERTVPAAMYECPAGYAKKFPTGK